MAFLYADTESTTLKHQQSPAEQQNVIQYRLFLSSSSSFSRKLKLNVMGKKFFFCCCTWLIVVAGGFFVYFFNKTCSNIVIYDEKS